MNNSKSAPPEKFKGEEVNQALKRLAENMEITECPALKIVVCGGAALNVLGLVTRPTSDIDVLGTTEEGRIERPRFPEKFKQVIKEMSEESGYRKDWINTGPSMLIEYLPEGLTDRLTHKSYGNKLDVYFLSRRDQIFFKMYASVNKGGYHYNDLQQLNPSAQEARESAAWTFYKIPKQIPLEETKQQLKQVLEGLGYNELIKEFE